MATAATAATRRTCCRGRPGASRRRPAASSAPRPSAARPPAASRWSAGQASPRTPGAPTACPSTPARTAPRRRSAARRVIAPPGGPARTPQWPGGPRPPLARTTITAHTSSPMTCRRSPGRRNPRTARRVEGEGRLVLSRGVAATRRRAAVKRVPERDDAVPPARSSPNDRQAIRPFARNSRRLVRLGARVAEEHPPRKTRPARRHGRFRPAACCGTVDTCHSFRASSVSAATRSGCACPRAFTAIPATQSRYAWPSVSIDQHPAPCPAQTPFSRTNETCMSFEFNCTVCMSHGSVLLPRNSMRLSSFRVSWFRRFSRFPSEPPARYPLITAVPPSLASPARSVTTAWCTRSTPLPSPTAPSGSSRP